MQQSGRSRGLHRETMLIGQLNRQITNPKSMRVAPLAHIGPDHRCVGCLVQALQRDQTGCFSVKHARRVTELIQLLPHHRRGYVNLRHIQQLSLQSMGRGKTDNIAGLISCPWVNEEAAEPKQFRHFGPVQKTGQLISAYNIQVLCFPGLCLDRFNGFYDALP
ncbi:hypothetical protein SDC9_172018 [bioreactor metagenome]|uniref:Uncharacterized protein n=1 Tax=bioreactor metagenome TaxID=1076179 RepID=A0A645GCI8_9ZZZZ